MIFGRYNETVLAPVMVFGLWALIDVGRRARSVRPLTVGIAVVAAASGLVLRLGRSPQALAGPFGPIDVLAIHLPLELLGRIDVAVLVVAGTVTAAVVVALARRAGTAGLAVILTPLFVAAACFSARRLAADSGQRRTRTVIAAAIQSIRARVPGSVSCVGAQDMGTYYWYIDNDAFLLPDLRFEDLDGRQTGPCSSLVVTATADLALREPGTQPLAREPGVPLTLWLRPGPFADQVRALAPPSHSGPAVMPLPWLAGSGQAIAGAEGRVLVQDRQRDQARGRARR